MAERSWKYWARKRETNPEYPKTLLKSIKTELDKRKQPDRAYIKSKLRALEDFVENDANFVSDRELHEIRIKMQKVV